MRTNFMALIKFFSTHGFSLRKMNFDILTLSDCVEAFEKKGWEAIIKGGHIVGFEREIT